MMNFFSNNLESGFSHTNAMMRDFSIFKKGGF